ncbi:YolD-like protein [Bifidobacterium italicum]|uniref:YolD-like protein n=1 Tax=Bifidobacterium italicum TaxID=1960968 RepID=A0A2A2EMG1_9BIFI|nr:hypothetical protein [Bifidobacterium italicum]PAU70080.1 YolD-like protein [Bifidobacterium italicum]
MSLERTHRYDDIIDMPHHRSQVHAPLSAAQRAAQFMPFAALAGYEEIVEDAARPRVRRIELGQDAREELDRRLAALLARFDDAPRVAVTYFVPEDGGSRHRGGGQHGGINGGINSEVDEEFGTYVTVRGAVTRYDGTARRLLIVDEHGAVCVVPWADIVRIVVDG